MQFSDYQQATRETDQRVGRDLLDITVHPLGLLGEAGSVATEYKKHLRDGDAHTAWKSRMREELGDVLWYAATLASKLDLNLDDIAAANLHKTRDRWLRSDTDPFDAHYPEQERLPLHAQLEFVPDTDDHGRPTVQVKWGDRWCGDRLTDASHTNDGYRFHDVFHLAYATVLGWSPVTRKLLGRKRRSNPQADLAEDGGRAIVIEEGVAAMAFAYAASHNYLRDVTRLDFQLLDTITNLVSPLEVGVRTAADWEQAILTGFTAWRKLHKHNGGTLILNRTDRTLTVEDR
jgi:NTP pyrophosphatase (non-canonical NTP hydrolase)